MKRFPESYKIEIGDVVLINHGTKTYDGDELPSFVFSRTYKVDYISGVKAVLDKERLCISVNVLDLTVVYSDDKTVPYSADNINVGNMVRVRVGSRTYTGSYIKSFVYSTVYRVDEIKGTKAVLNRDGINILVNIADLTRA